MIAKTSILIVDDDASLRRTLSDVLRVKGYTPLSFDTGRAALDGIQERAPVVALIDLKLGDMPGLKVMEAIKKRSPATECIVLTGYASQASAIEAINLGAYGYLQKPYDIEQLMLTIRRAIEKRQAEEALVEKERYFRSLLYTIHEDILVIDADYRIADVNETFLLTTGHRREDVIGQPCFAVSHGYDAPCDQHGQTCTLKEVFETGQPRDCRHRYTRTDGSKVYVDILLSPLKDERGSVTHVVEAVRDITDMMEAQKALRYQAYLLDNVFDAIISTDVDFVVQSWNRAAERTYGWKAHEALGHPLGKITKAEYPYQSREVFTQEFAEKGYYEGEVIHHRKDGTPINIWRSVSMLQDSDGNPVGAVSVNRDVTERALLLEEVREQAQRMQQTIDAVPEGVLLLDAEGRVIRANPMAERDLTILAEAKVGDTLAYLGDLPLDELLVPSAGQPWHQIEAQGRTFEIIARPLEAGLGADGWVLVIRDMTRDREIQRRVQQQDRLAAVGQLAAGIAHDFNNIMAVITLYSSMTLRAPNLPPDIQRRLVTINRQAKRASALIQQILDFGRRAVLERLPMDLVPFLKEQVKLLERTIPENISIDLAYGTGHFTVNADPTRMQQVIVNLAVNARDAMPDGGELHIRLERLRIEDDREGPLPDMKAGQWVQVTVEDTGTGIPADVLPHILEPFHTTKAPGKGSGLGLAQVYGIVKQHEGEVGVTTTMGEGTTFTLYLPALPIAQPEETDLETERLVQGRGETILVVEDDARTREALADSLELLGYQALTAVNGREALDIFERHGGDPSAGPRQGIALVLSDLVMPVMGGKALFRALKQRLPGVKMIMLTGHPREKELQALMAEGLSGRMLKPPSIEQLAEVVARTLEESQTGQ